MTHPRPYRRKLGRDEAAAGLKKGSGTLFDPRVVQAMLEVLREEG